MRGCDAGEGTLMRRHSPVEILDITMPVVTGMVLRRWV